MTGASNRYYLPEKQSEAELKKLRLRNVCKECGERLSTWIDGHGAFYLACHRHDRNRHEGIAKEFIPPSEKEILIRREGMSDENVGQHRSLALRGVPLTGLLTQEQATKVLKTVWKDAPDDEVLKAAILCKDFGLHPLMKHVFLIKFDGKKGPEWATVLGIGATRLMVSRQGSFSYVDDTPRIMSDEEQKRIFGKVDPVNIVAITRLRTKDGLQAQGYGKYPKNATPFGADKGNSAENMAFIRSERNAFGRLFPDARMPADVEVVDEAYMPLIQVDRADTETGEIIPPKPEPPLLDAESPSAPPKPQPISVGMDYNAFWKVVVAKDYTPTEVELQLGYTVPTWLRKPENKGKTLDDILTMLPAKARKE